MLLGVHRHHHKLIKQLLLSILICVLAGLAWYANFIFLLNINKSLIVHQQFSILKEILSMLLFGHAVIGKLLSVAFLLFMCYVILQVWRASIAVSFEHKIILLIGFCTGIIILLSPFLPYLFQYRHYMVFLPILLISMAILLRYFDFSLKSLNLLFGLGLVIVISQGYTFYKSNREEWRQAVKYIVDTNKGKNTKVIILGEPWEKSHKDYLLIDPGYLNISIRRKAFYNFYFEKFDVNHNLELVVMRPMQNEIENFIQNELEYDNPIFILSHAEEYQSKIKSMILKKPIQVFEKKFYKHEVYRVFKN